MIEAAALALTLSAAAPADPDAIQIVRDACIGTELRRAAFEQLGRERRWRSARMTRSSGQTGWTMAFQTDGAMIMLMAGPVPARDPGLGDVCSVSVDRASDRLEAEVAALAAELGLEAEAVPTAGLGGRVTVWSKPGEATLALATGADNDPRAVVSFSRQIMIQEPAPAAPSGAGS